MLQSIYLYYSCIGEQGDPWASKVSSTEGDWEATRDFFLSLCLVFLAVVFLTFCLGGCLQVKNNRMILGQVRWLLVMLRIPVVAGTPRQKTLPAMMGVSVKNAGSIEYSKFLLLCTCRCSYYLDLIHAVMCRWRTTKWSMGKQDWF